MTGVQTCALPIWNAIPQWILWLQQHFALFTRVHDLKLLVASLCSILSTPELISHPDTFFQLFCLCLQAMKRYPDAMRGNHKAYLMIVRSGLEDEANGGEEDYGEHDFAYDDEDGTVFF